MENKTKNETDVVIYTTPTCGYCKQVKGHLRDRGVEFMEHDVSVDQEKRAEMVELSGQMGVPVTTIGDGLVVGFSKRRIDELLADSSSKAEQTKSKSCCGSC